MGPRQHSADQPDILPAQLLPQHPDLEVAEVFMRWDPMRTPTIPNALASPSSPPPPRSQVGDSAGSGDTPTSMGLSDAAANGSVAVIEQLHVYNEGVAEHAMPSAASISDGGGAPNTAGESPGQLCHCRGYCGRIVCRKQRRVTQCGGRSRICTRAAAHRADYCVWCKCEALDCSKPRTRGTKRWCGDHADYRNHRAPQYVNALGAHAFEPGCSALVHVSLIRAHARQSRQFN